MTRLTSDQTSETFIVERRRNPYLRALYPEVSVRIAQSFEKRSDWLGNPIDYLALRLVHEHYPQLSSEEVRTLVGAIERHMLEGYSHD